MQVAYRYAGRSGVADSPSGTTLAFAPDTLRPATFFNGEVGDPVPFREGISALHAVVTTDNRPQPKDRTAYFRWLKDQEERLMAEALGELPALKERITDLRGRLDQVRRDKAAALRPYYEAQERYFRYLYRINFLWWVILDPVVTVHPDEVFFEAFSRDESVYGRLACDLGQFRELGEMQPGTTNVDYSAGLYDAFQKMRSYKATRLNLAPEGLAVRTTGEAEHVEEKIDLPDSWVRGFLQVSSAMTLPTLQFSLEPMEMQALLTHLARRREQFGPRSIRFRLVPGRPVEALIEPWNTHITFARSIYAGPGPQEVRLWGRRRLATLARLIPVARRFHVHLLGTGLPSFFIADMGPLTFTLGLSGWTANDWSRAGQFDLMAPRGDVDEITRARVFAALSESWVETPVALAARLGLERGTVLSALGAWVQAGRAMADLSKGVYRRRELTREPLPAERLRFASEREAMADRFIAAGLVSLDEAVETPQGARLTGRVLDNARSDRPSLLIDQDQRLVSASCTCNHYIRNRLYQGPCEHMLAVRRAFAERTTSLAGGET